MDHEYAAFHGSALNPAYTPLERLTFALRACELYEAEVERLRNEIKALRNEEDYDPAPIITEYDRMASQVERLRADLDDATRRMALAVEALESP